ncbi:MAG: F0F1 ATP synthase subunit beta, partial [Clostridiales bacterium]|nr:F0F1 ATP synthase subunit beta [Clostridiales bacterium]
MAENIGHIVQIIGPVLDVRFEPDRLPRLYNALIIDAPEGKIVAEVLQHTGNNTARCIAMNP